MWVSIVLTSKFNGSIARRRQAAVVESVLPTQQQRTDDRKRNLKFFSVQFDGILQVTDQVFCSKHLTKVSAVARHLASDCCRLHQLRSWPNSTDNCTLTTT